VLPPLGANRRCGLREKHLTISETVPVWVGYTEQITEIGGIEIEGSDLIGC
jgi:hypothetical protein